MKKPSAGNHAFTLVELMIVIAIIAVIAGIGIPSWMRARETAQRTELMNELRTTSEAFQTYAAEQNKLPATSTFQELPAGMAPYMPNKSTWTTSAGGGGYWCWLNLTTKVRGYNAFIGLYGSGLSSDSIQQLDDTMDDGNTDTGAITTGGVNTGGPAAAGWVFYGVQGYQ